MSGLGRSLSLNTGATSGGLFGSSTSQPAQQSTLFGGTLTQPPTQQSGGLFGNTSTGAKSQPTSLFGNTATSQPQPQPQPQSHGGGLFGNSAATSSQPQSGGLFGSSAAPKPAGGGLFGGGLFGSGAAASSQPQAGGLFASTTQPKPSGLFGSGPANPGSGGGGGGGGGGGLFGSTQPQQRPPLFTNSSAFGGGPSGTSGGASGGGGSTVPGVTLENAKPTTRFSELQPDAQNLIIQLDDLISGAIRSSLQCSELMPVLSQKLASLPGDVDFLDTKLESVEGSLLRDARDVQGAKQVAKKDAQDVYMLRQVIENLNLPQQFHYGGASSFLAPAGDELARTDLLAYFNERTDELQINATTYEKQLQEVESHLRTVEGSAVEGIEKLIRQRSLAGHGNGGEDRGMEGLRELVGAMRGFEEAILRVAERLGKTREEVVDLTMANGIGRG